MAERQRLANCWAALRVQPLLQKSGHAKVCSDTDMQHLSQIAISPRLLTVLPIVSQAP